MFSFKDKHYQLTIEHLLCTIDIKKKRRNANFRLFLLPKLLLFFASYNEYVKSTVKTLLVDVVGKGRIKPPFDVFFNPDSKWHQIEFSQTKIKKRSKPVKRLSFSFLYVLRFYIYLNKYTKLTENTLLVVVFGKGQINPLFDVFFKP